MAPRQFDPQAHETYRFFGERYTVQPHPASPNRRYAQVGGRGRVFQLLGEKDKQLWAIKVFHKRYREPGLHKMAQHLSSLAGYEGMRAAGRRVILPSDSAAREYPNLEYAMLMPWVRGKTWYDVLVEAAQKGSSLPWPTSLRLCVRFLKILSDLEAGGIAHTDIAPGNVMVDMTSFDVQLLDLEDIYLPSLKCAKFAKGSKGYRHQSGDSAGQNFWCAEGDRYAAAVLSAEMLLLAKPDLARRSTDEGFFTDHCDSPEGAVRYAEARGWLRQVAPGFASVFEHSWYAKTLQECPRIAELYSAVREVSPAAALSTHAAAAVKAAAQSPPPDVVKWVPRSPANIAGSARRAELPVVWQTASQTKQTPAVKTPSLPSLGRAASVAVPLLIGGGLLLFIVLLLLVLLS